MARKLKIMENEKHPLDDLENDGSYMRVSRTDKSRSQNFLRICQIEEDKEVAASELYF